MIPPTIQLATTSSHCFKAEIRSQRFSDHYGIVVRCAAKKLGITATSKGSVPLVSTSFCPAVFIGQTITRVGDKNSQKLDYVILERSHVYKRVLFKED
uniref:Uncharacterized protein n=1 Tax=Acrobeloides nanus TaxID=290746 RepID=A0A914EBT0_9BILA